MEHRMTQPTTSLQKALTAPYPFHAIAAEDAGWYIYFPDLPGCTTFAETWEELAHSAHEAVTSWLAIEDERGHPLPAPTLGGKSPWLPGDFLVTSSKTPTKRSSAITAN
jgi:predicted RNase H-like HicB family nuclease